MIKRYTKFVSDYIHLMNIIRDLVSTQLSCHVRYIFVVVYKLFIEIEVLIGKGFLTSTGSY